MAEKVCQDCRYNINGHCHGMPPRWTTDPREQWKYPPVIPTAEACSKFQQKVP